MFDYCTNCEEKFVYFPPLLVNCPVCKRPGQRSSSLVHVPRLVQRGGQPSWPVSYDEDPIDSLLGIWMNEEHSRWDGLINYPRKMGTAYLMRSLLSQPLTIEPYLDAEVQSSLTTTTDYSFWNPLSAQIQWDQQKPDTISKLVSTIHHLPFGRSSKEVGYRFSHLHSFSQYQQCGLVFAASLWLNAKFVTHISGKGQKTTIRTKGQIDDFSFIRPKDLLKRYEYGIEDEPVAALHIGGGTIDLLGEIDGLTDWSSYTPFFLNKLRTAKKRNLSISGKVTLKEITGDVFGIPFKFSAQLEGGARYIVNGPGSDTVASIDIDKLELAQSELTVGKRQFTIPQRAQKYLFQRFKPQKIELRQTDKGLEPKIIRQPPPPRQPLTDSEVFMLLGD